MRTKEGRRGRFGAFGKMPQVLIFSGFLYFPGISCQEVPPSFQCIFAAFLCTQWSNQLWFSAQFPNESSFRNAPELRRSHENCR